MSSKILVLFSTLLLLTACNTAGNLGNSSNDSVKTSSTADRYRIESQDLEAFDLINGSNVGARANDRVFFDYDSAVLNSSSQKTLDRQAKWLNKNSDVQITIEGHCDERGTREYNLALGDRRANATKNYLVSSGVEASRITVVSFGKERPAVAGSNSAAWAENRRSVTIPAI